jgi:hypothetical protein
MIKPITPDEIRTRKLALMPSAVIEVFNSLIVEKWNGREATIRQIEAAERIAAKLEVSVDSVLNNNLLDIQLIFEGAGWHVLSYNKLACNETEEPTIRFTKK